MQTALNRLSDASQRLHSLQEENEALKTKVNLQEGREKLIAHLRQKAVEFENFIREKQSEQTDCSTQTEGTGTNEIDAVKYVTALKEKELEIHQRYKEQFAERLKRELEKIPDESAQDRLAVSQLLKKLELELQTLKVKHSKEMDDIRQSSDEEKSALSTQILLLQKAVQAKESGEQAECSKCLSFEEILKNVHSQMMLDREGVGELVKNWQAQLQSLTDKRNKEIENAVKPYKDECVALTQKIVLMQAASNRNGHTLQEVKVSQSRCCYHYTSITR